MPRNFKKSGQNPVARGQRTPARTARMVLGALLGLNLIAAGLVLYPPGGSAEALAQELVTLQTQVATARVRLDRTRTQASFVEKGRGEGDEFLKTYFVGERELTSILTAELIRIADQTKIRDRGSSYTIEKIDGSDTLNMVTISANFEGTYRNLLDFVRQVDRSETFLIIESLNATPQPNANVLTVAMKLEAFVRSDGMPLDVAPVAVTRPANNAETAQ